MNLSFGICRLQKSAGKRAHMQLVGGMCSSRTSWKTSPEYGETPKSSSAKPSTTAETEDDCSLSQTSSCYCEQVEIKKNHHPYINTTTTTASNERSLHIATHDHQLAG